VKVYPGGVVQIKIWRIKKAEWLATFCEEHAWINSGDESIVGWSLFIARVKIQLPNRGGFAFGRLAEEILHASSIEKGALNPL